MSMQILKIARGTSIAIVMALAASSCGGSTQAEVASELEPADAAPTTQATTTTEAVTTTTSPVDVDRYCELAIIVESKGDSFFDGDGPADPAQLEAFLVDIQEDMTDAIKVADPVIMEDVVLLKEELAYFVELMEEYDYDLRLAVSEVGEQPTRPEWDAAQEAVDAYDEEVCGLDKNTDDVEEAEPISEMESAGSVTLEEAQLAVTLMETQAGLDLVVEGFISEVPAVTVEQAECFLKSLTPEQFVSFAQLGSSDAEIDLSDPAISAILIIFDTCDIPLSALLPSS